MNQNHEKKITVTRTIEAPADAVFEVLTNPKRHREFDGSGFVRSEDQGDRITATGQVFTMNMEGDHMGGEYKTDNHVTGYVKDKLVAWQTAPAGTEPKGWEWVWELEPNGQRETQVSLTYDWSKVTDKELLQKISFPLVPEADLQESLQLLSSVV
ncbi:SRPBCC family protein [Calidifontibacter indicus]|uniref:Activator of Hsp90 ATPase-like protein n=1 Tax=Calidifontibacter indicus TaxID=419650 RepID=A0A3D9UL39_9MICO|nr:SRPBCC family protein [Calidifontibacter indicus]REF29133.1 activator of Hsp90 ATPase-like protein [Calidifontibacter indicus]